MLFRRISTEFRSDARLLSIPIATTISVALVLFIGLQAFNLFAGFNPDTADIKNDWVVASALIDGENPFGDLNDLAATYAPGSYVPPPVDPAASGVVRTPRTPGSNRVGGAFNSDSDRSIGSIQ